MNISAWTIYWFIKLDAIINIVGGLAAFSIVATIVCIGIAFIAWISYLNATESYRENTEAFEKRKESYLNITKAWVKIVKRIIILPFLLLILSNMLPTTKEMATIYVIPKIANSNFVNETLPAEMKDIYGMAKQWMKETLKTPDVKAEPVKAEAEQKK